MKTTDLKPCPINFEIYGELQVTELMEDVRANGILEPIVVNQDNVVISGHRRLQCARALGLTEVPCKAIETTEDTLIPLIMSYNKQRVKNYTQLYHEMKHGGRPGHISKGMELRINRLHESIDPSAPALLAKVIAGTKTVSQAYKDLQKNEQLALIKKRGEQARLDGGTIYNLRHGDFREVLADIPDGSVDAIITDPPYPREFVDLFGELAKFASKKLSVGGWLVVYSGELYLPEVFAQLQANSKEGLKYYWTMCLSHEGSRQLLQAVNVQPGWKPIIVYRKQPLEGRQMKYDGTLNDVVVSLKREKAAHEWQQSESGVAELVTRFTKEGELVVDPFAGSGTTLKVCEKLGRKAIGAEIDEVRCAAGSV